MVMGASAAAAPRFSRLTHTYGAKGRSDGPCQMRLVPASSKAISSFTTHQEEAVPLRPAAIVPTHGAKGRPTIPMPMPASSKATSSFTSTPAAMFPPRRETFCNRNCWMHLSPHCLISPLAPLDVGGMCSWSWQGSDPISSEGDKLQQLQCGLFDLGLLHF